MVLTILGVVFLTSNDNLKLDLQKERLSNLSIISVIEIDKTVYANDRIASIDKYLKSKYLGDSMRKHLETERAKIVVNKIGCANEAISRLQSYNTKFMGKISRLDTEIREVIK